MRPPPPPPSIRRSSAAKSSHNQNCNNAMDGKSRRRKHRYHLNTLWSIWYGLLFTYLQGYLILNGTYRFLGKCKIPADSDVSIRRGTRSIALSSILFIVYQIYSGFHEFSTYGLIEASSKHSPTTINRQLHREYIIIINNNARFSFQFFHNPFGSYCIKRFAQQKDVI